ncbi:hypothetical protein BGW36DRAFT_185727 [Talaromyces proteolyticus]|uniref:Uncharacterized protein n=1 Tax=Talaromyces proteolyticus TaxID=1131652 RepID=A0AAD4PZG5_9EURO|nr:uncharacterized protein BGW36DRAFT_185727 [Talaromyces proteolyticus]KAH8696367.1 hypothetical protein BGW36DRAFT_185727 [Talaromyces proteolyticus]
MGGSFQSPEHHQTSARANWLGNPCRTSSFVADSTRACGEVRTPPARDGPTNLLASPEGAGADSPRGRDDGGGGGGWGRRLGLPGGIVREPRGSQALGGGVRAIVDRSFLPFPVFCSPESAVQPGVPWFQPFWSSGFPKASVTIGGVSCLVYWFI